MGSAELQRRLRALLTLARLPPASPSRYAFAIFATFLDRRRWVLVVGTPSGEVLPLTARILGALYSRPTYLFGRTTALLTATDGDLADDDLVDELEILTIHSAVRGGNTCGQAQLRSYVTANNLDDALLFVTPERPEGWPP